MSEIARKRMFLQMPSLVFHLFRTAPSHRNGNAANHSVDGTPLPNKFPAFLQGTSRIAAETTVVFGLGWCGNESPTLDAVKNYANILSKSSQKRKCFFVLI